MRGGYNMGIYNGLGLGGSPNEQGLVDERGDVWSGPRGVGHLDEVGDVGQPHR